MCFWLKLVVGKLANKSTFVCWKYVWFLSILFVFVFICFKLIPVSDGKDGLRRWQQRNLPSPVCVCHKHPLAGSSQSQSVKHICFCLWSFATALAFCFDFVSLRSRRIIQNQSTFSPKETCFTATKAYLHSKNFDKIYIAIYKITSKINWNLMKFILSVAL